MQTMDSDYKSCQVIVVPLQQWPALCEPDFLCVSMIPLVVATATPPRVDVEECVQRALEVLQAWRCVNLIVKR